MANTVIALKKSGTPSSVPSNLANGELAINYADGKLYYKAANGTIAAISGNEPNYFGSVSANGTLIIADLPGDILTLNAGENIEIVGDSINDTITISASILPAFAQANIARDHANAAFNKANTANITADRAWNHANAGYAFANSIAITANLAFAHANAAFLAANTGGGGITYVKKTSNYTAVSGDGIIADTSAGSFSITLPLSPTVGNQIVIVDGNNWAANSLTVLRNGSTIEDVAEDLILDVAATSVTFIYDGNTWETYFQLGISSLGTQNNILTAAIAAFEKANVANITADLAFTHANNSYAKANVANITADRAWNHANAAFANANTVMISAQAAFTVANSGFLHANAAFNKANTANITADRAWNHANAAFANANTVMVSAQSAFTVANSGFLHANAGYAFANSISITANLAFAHANAAFANGNTVIQTAQSAFTQANAALASASAGQATANAAYAFANSAHSIANLAFTHANNAYNVANNALSKTGGSITGNLAITGSLTVSGNVFMQDTETLRIGDPLLYLAGNNYTSDIVDIGFVANYVNVTGQNVHTGIFRDATSKEYYIFEGYDQEPNPNHIDIAGNNFTISTLNATLKTSNLILGGTNTIPWLTAAFNKANSALPNTSGVSFAGNLFFPTGIIGIGLANPAQKLHIYGSDANAITRFTAANTLGAGSRSFDVGVRQHNTIVYPYFGYGIWDTNGDTNVFYIDWNTKNTLLSPVSGSVGIGTLSPATKLEVNGIITANSTLIVKPLNGGSEGGEIQLVGSGSYDRKYIDSFNDQLRIFTISANNNLFRVYNGGTGTFGLDVQSYALVATMNVVPTIQASYIQANTAYTAANNALDTALAFAIALG